MRGKLLAVLLGTSALGGAAQAATLVTTGDIRLAAGEPDRVVEQTATSILVRGTLPEVAVGFDGTGSMSLSDGAEVKVERIAGPTDTTNGTFNLGRREGSTGSLTVDASRIEVTTTSGPFGAIFFVGRSGSGSVSFTNGSELLVRTLTPTSALTAQGASAFIIAAAGSATGSAVVDASTVTADNGNENAFVDVGRMGSGTLVVRNGGLVRALGDQSRVLVGRFPGSSGSLTIDGPGSVVSSGFIATIGQNRELDGRIEAGGTGTVTLLDGGTLSVPDLFIGSGGTLSGTGTITGIVHNEGGTVLPGSSPGTLTVGDYVQTAGTLVIEIAGPGAGQFDQLWAKGGTIDIQGGEIVLAFLDGYIPDAGDSFRFLRGAAILTFAGFEDAITITGLDPELTKLRFLPNGVSVSITPVPGAVLLFAPALVGLGLMSRRRARHA